VATVPYFNEKWNISDTLNEFDYVASSHSRDSVGIGACRFAKTARMILFARSNGGEIGASIIARLISRGNMNWNAA
jgi:hypothetical protein